MSNSHEPFYMQTQIFSRVAERSTSTSILFEDRLVPTRLTAADDHHHTFALCFDGIRLGGAFRQITERLESGSFIHTDKKEFEVPLTYLPTWLALFNLGDYVAIYVPITLNAPRPSSMHRINLLSLGVPDTDPSELPSPSGPQPTSRQHIMREHHTIVVNLPGRKPPPNSLRDNFSLLAA